MKMILIVAMVLSSSLWMNKCTVNTNAVEWSQQ